MAHHSRHRASEGSIRPSIRSSNIRSKPLKRDGKFHIRDLLEAAPEAIAVIDATGRIILVNRKLEELFGYERAELIGHPQEDLIPERHRAAHVSYRAGYFERPSIRPMGDATSEVMGLRKDGSEFPAEVSLGYLENGDGVMAIALIRDETTWRRAAFRERAAREEADRARRMHDEALTLVAHDLRNLLHNVIVRATWLARAPEEDAREVLLAARSNGARIETSVRRMNALIGDLLDTARIAEGHFSVTPRECSVHDIVTEALDAFYPLCAKNGLSLSADVREPSLRAWCDGDRVQQVLGNLLGNAIKFTPSGGSITITAERTGAELRFAVQDTGPGIDAEARDRIFQRYGQARERDRTSGLGLGLFIAKGIVEAHGGRIWVESAVEHGATFAFTLPTR